MNHAVLVRGFERLGDLSRDRQRFVDRHRPLSDAIGERRSFDELEHQSALIGLRFLRVPIDARAMCG